MELLASLVIVEESGAHSYVRDDYSHWSTQPSGCSTRVEVLIAESTSLAQVDRYGTCAVVAGDWWSAYDDVFIDDAAELDIDHVVPLAEAHRSGAVYWDPQRREAFANDLAHPGSLIAVTASSNRSKSDGDPASWVPSNGAYRCEYLARWVEVKVRWELSVDPTEHDVISTGLTDCPAHYASPATPPPPSPVTGTPPHSQVSPAPGGVPWYANCSEVHAADAAPITTDDPGFRSAFDRDGDGVGCE